MRVFRHRLALRFIAALCLLAAFAIIDSTAGARTQPAHRSPASAPAHLLVYAQEWSMWPSRTSLPAGTVDVQLWNRGQDAHDVRVRRLNATGAMVGAMLAGVSVTPSGAIHSAVWHLSAGHYEIYCSLPGHLAMGMHARITVTA